MKQLYILMILSVAFGALACSDDDDEPGCFTCLYEKRSTSCSSGSFNGWEEGSSTIDFELRDGLSREDFCRQAYPASDIECGGGCCISFQFRDVRVGSCP